MKAIVCVKQVPDTSGKVAVKADGTMDRASMATITNPDDMNAIEAALKLKDETGCEVTVVSMGPPPAEGMLRELLAMGADKAVLVSGREFGGSDTYATSQILAAALKKIGVLLREAGVGSAFVDFGNSSILGIGRHPYGPCWRVSLPDPATGNALAEFDLVDRALSVSGNTAAHAEHIVNPHTGLRDASRQIVAVVADDPLDAEVVSTAWMIAGEPQRRRIACGFDKLEVYAYILHHG